MDSSFCILDDIAQGFITGFHALFSFFFIIFNLNVTHTHTHIHLFKRVTGKNKEIENYFNSSPEDYYSKLSEAHECRQSGGRRLMQRSSTFRFLKTIKGDRNDSQVFDCFQWLWWWWWWWWLRLRLLAQQNEPFEKVFWICAICHWIWIWVSEIKRIAYIFCLKTDKMRKCETFAFVFEFRCFCDCVLPLFSTNRQSSS